MSSLLQVTGLSRRYGGLVAVDDLSFHVDEGEIVGLIGPNGAGKTTTFNLLSGAVRPTRGSIRFRDTEIAGLKSHAICKLGMTRTFQVVQPFPDMTALENVMVGAFVRHSSRTAAEGKAHESLVLVEMDGKADTLGRDLTLMELKKLEIGKALATEPKLLLLDEVASGLNPVEIDGILALVRRLRDSGITLLVVEHVMKVIMSLSDRIVVLNFGSKIAEGTPKEISANHAVLDAYLGEEEYVA
jgi:branched-chain amino acid transport system ATP-binding protein